MKSNLYPINLKATKIMNNIMKLYDQAITTGKQYLKLDNSSTFMYLAVEKPYGDDIISLAHYGIENGDPMRDPEMLFLIRDGRYYPMYFRNDYARVETESMILADDGNWKVCRPMQRDQKDFANIWLNNIKEQQGI